uniref:Putative secreted protein n=1 Tax=Anopheles darlingi TaxID=43151 RepID=A0A2M4DFJ2_ANODA
MVTPVLPLMVSSCWWFFYLAERIVHVLEQNGAEVVLVTDVTIIGMIPIEVNLTQSDELFLRFAALRCEQWPMMAPLPATRHQLVGTVKDDRGEWIDRWWWWWASDSGRRSRRGCKQLLKIL